MIFKGLPKILKFSEMLAYRRTQNILLFDKERTHLATINNIRDDIASAAPFLEEEVFVTGIENDDLWAVTFIDLDRSEFFKRREEFNEAKVKFLSAMKGETT